MTTAVNWRLTSFCSPPLCGGLAPPAVAAAAVSRYGELGGRTTPQPPGKLALSWVDIAHCWGQIIGSRGWQQISTGRIKAVGTMRWRRVDPFTIFGIYTWKNLKLYKKNSYLSHRVIDSFPWILKWKIVRLKPVLLAPRTRRPGLKKWYYYFWLFVENCYTLHISMAKNWF